MKRLAGADSTLRHAAVSASLAPSIEFPGHAMRRLATILRPSGPLWSHGDFLRLWAAQATSAFGSRISRTVLPVIALLIIDASPAEIGVLSALSVAPGVVVGLLFGGMVDRAAKRRLLIGADLVRAALLFTVPAAAWLGWLTMGQLYLVAAGVGAASVVFQLADNAYLPVLIGKPNLVEGNAKLESTEAVAEIGGPSLAGLLIEIVTAPFAVLFDVATYLASAGFLATITAREPPAPADPQRPTLLSDLIAGLRAGFGNRLVRPLFLVEGAMALFGGFFFTLYMVFTIDTLALSPGVVGVLIGVGGVGALFGAAIAGALRDRIRLGPAMLVMLAVGQGSALLIPTASGPDWAVLAFLTAHQLLGDGFLVAYAIHAVSLRQTVLPQGLLARANGTLHVLIGLLLPAGALLSGWLATAIGVREAVWVGVIGGLTAPLILALSPVARLKRMPEV